MFDYHAIKAKIGDRRVVASVSGGKDSAAMSLFLTELGIDHERVFMDTGWEHPKLYEYLRGPLTTKLGPITELRGRWTFQSLVEHKQMFPSRVARFCTVELKVKPLQEYINGLVEAGEEVLNTVGIRRAESAARAKMAEWEWSEGFDCEVWRPLVNWSEADVIAIHKRHGLDLNPLYAMGASRVGCWPCIHARKGELAHVANTDPERIVQIGRMEGALNTKAAAKGEINHLRTMFSFKNREAKHIPMPIEQAVEWARSKRGEWQPPGAGDGCVRHGLCETDTKETD